MTETDTNCLATVYLVDDDIDVSQSLLRRLSREESSFSFSHFANAKDALKNISKNAPEVVVVDIELVPEMGPESGLKLIRDIFNQDPTVRILALTGHSAAEVGLLALKAGAASFLQKPAELPHLLSLIRDGVAYSQLKREHLLLQSAASEHRSDLGISSRSKRMLGVLQQVSYAASNSMPILLLGETGTGKGLIARAIHEASSRKSKHFVRLQPQYGSPELTASALFGHSRGAFTGAHTARRGLLQEADKGSLFLDEVDQLPQETQVTLLEVLQEGVFRQLGSNDQLRTDVRLISASNKPFEELVANDALRQDFYHRIAHCTITIPPLRERTEEIPDLANLFLKRLTTKEELVVLGFSSDALTFLSQQDWPGNVRQLQGVVESGIYKAAFNARSLVELEDFKTDSSNSASVESNSSFREQVRNFEYSLVQKALNLNENNQTKAAESLQLDRSSFRRIFNRK